MVIETVNLTKVYASGAGCRDITLSVGAGEVFGLLGPNGAGKSTFVKILVGLLLPTSGEARLLGRPLGDMAARREIGFLPENFRFHEWMTGEELLAFHAAFFGLAPQDIRRRIPEVLEMVNLNGVAKRRVGAFSKGMQQRIGLAAALLARPRLVFLDEPTSALDPVGRKEVRKIIGRLRAEGTTVFLNSHLLSEVEMVCDRVAIINRGCVVAAGSMTELLRRGVEVEARVEDLGPGALNRLQTLTQSLSLDGDKLMAVLNTEDDIPALARNLVMEGARLFSLAQRRHSLEDVFLELVGEVGEDA